MKPAPFEMVVAESFEEAAGVLESNGDDAQVLAGGQSLVAMLNMRLAKPSILVDINRVPGGDDIAYARGVVRVGVRVRQRTLEIRPQTGIDLPLLAQALPYVGHVQTRSRGTICGSVCHADPSAEIPLCLLALDGDVELQHGRKRRTVPAKEFFTGLLSTARSSTEVVRSVGFPTAKANHGYAFSEVAERHGDFAIASFAAVAGPGFVRLAVGGVADRPIARTWQTTNEEDLAGAVHDLAWDLGATDDPHASARYRRDLVRNLGLATVRTALTRSETSPSGT